MAKSRISNLKSRISNRSPVRPSAHLPVCPLTVWVLACSSADVPATGIGTVTDSAGVTIVSNSKDGAWQAGEAWTLEEDLRIGMADGDPNYFFGRIAGICVDSEEQIYVVDGQAAQVSVYDADGVYQHAFGENGAGPGQFGNLIGPCLDGPGDSLFIPDLQNNRFNRFARDGSFGGSFMVNILEGVPVGWDVMPGGRPVQQLRFFGLPGGAGAQFGDSLQILVAREADGSAKDTLLVFPAGGTVSITSGRGAIVFFAPEPSWAVTDDGGLLYGRNDEYRIRRYDADGNLTRIFEMPFEAEPVGEAERAVVEAVVLEWMRGQGMPESVLENTSSFIRFAASFPAFHRFVRGPRGTLWVQGVIRPSELPDASQLNAIFDNLDAFLTDPHLGVGSGTWDVFDADGRFLGPVTMPTGFRPLKFTDDAVYGVWRGELGVEYVVRLKVVGF